MYRGDRSRKKLLVNYGFRLPSPLKTDHSNLKNFESYDFQTVYVSATPGHMKSRNQIILLSKL
ncbi:MAG: hypothetical protein CM15mP63_4900 [Gammaproteobacteria bacterium]|nr:MAG: hypothetical protein CM15mP63_4900 [Gammaproteobacteria bacterium]